MLVFGEMLRQQADQYPAKKAKPGIVMKRPFCIKANVHANKDNRI